MTSSAKQIHRELRAKLKERESLIGDIEDLISEYVPLSYSFADMN